MSAAPEGTTLIDSLADLATWKRSGGTSPIAISPSIVRLIMEDYIDAIGELPLSLLPDEAYRLRDSTRALVAHNAKLAEELNLGTSATHAARELGITSDTEICVQAVTDLVFKAAKGEVDEDQSYRAALRVVQAYAAKEIVKAKAAS